MAFNGKYDNESWIDYKKELKVFLKDCFDHHDSNGKLDSGLIEKVEDALNIIIGFSGQYSIDQEEWSRLHKYLNLLYVGIPQDIENAKADFYQLCQNEIPENTG
jgi:hypothetical protein